MPSDAVAPELRTNCAMMTTMLSCVLRYRQPLLVLHPVDNGRENSCGGVVNALSRFDYGELNEAKKNRPEGGGDVTQSYLDARGYGKQTLLNMEPNSVNSTMPPITSTLTFWGNNF